MKRANYRLSGGASIRVGDRVRIQPHDGKQHFGRGRIVAIDGSMALVQPFGRHRRLEWIPLSGLRLWQSANEQSQLLAAGRKHA